MKEVTIDLIGTENATRAHNNGQHIPALSDINNSDIDDGWEETMDI